MKFPVKLGRLTHRNTHFFDSHWKIINVDGCEVCAVQRLIDETEKDHLKRAEEIVRMLNKYNDMVNKDFNCSILR